MPLKPRMTDCLSSKTRIRCLFVHGWGMNHSVWQPVLAELDLCGASQWLDAQTIDLPGHGQSHKSTFNGLQELTELLEAEAMQFADPAVPLVIVAWSMGALPALQLAGKKPELVDGLLLVSSSPCFVSREDWSVGVESEIFDQFAASLKNDFSGTIRRFLSLQVKGSESGRQLLRDLREKVLQQPAANPHSLDNGLALLKQVDLRQQLSRIIQPVNWVLGGQDGLVKADLKQALTTLMPEAGVEVFEKAGHAPFLSHTDLFVQQLVHFCQTVIDECE